MGWEIAENAPEGPIPLWSHPEWAARFPGLVQGTTGAGSPGSPFDLALFGDSPAGEVTDRWGRLLEASGAATAVHSRQVHGSEVARWEQPVPPGLVVRWGHDAHLTTRPGVLLTVSIADCVPIFLVHEPSRALALVHAGWRGVAAGVLERAVEALGRAGGGPHGIRLHCGPAICGRCYEVGPEVHAALRPGRTVPAKNAPIDLRGVLVERAVQLGIGEEWITVSTFCTRCDAPRFFSHRGGSLERQMGVLGWRD